MKNINRIKHILYEAGRKEKRDEFYYNYNPDAAPSTFKRMAKMRKTKSDSEIAKNASAWSGLNVSPHAVRYLFNKHKDHPDYVPPLIPDQPRHDEDFKKGITHLETMATEQRTAYMCSEAVWWRCHRSMVSDYLKVAGWKAIHILSLNKSDRKSTRLNSSHT